MSQEEQKMHPRNLHQAPYDLEVLIRVNPELKDCLKDSPDGRTSIDFSAPGVRALNKALLLAYYGLGWWDLPPGALCPPVPGRADYIHHLADLLASDLGEIPRGKQIRGLDVGTGASLIYPILGSALYRWSFVATDTNPRSLAWARLVLEANKGLQGSVELRKQDRPARTFASVIKPQERYACTLCNPPFHGSAQEAKAAAELRTGKMGLEQGLDPNFGGIDEELWCPGGELGFVGGMIAESREQGSRVAWFSSLVSRKESLPGLVQALKKAGATEHRTIPMAQGNKASRILAWTYLSLSDRKSLYGPGA